jgi:hypothetical protein
MPRRVGQTHEPVLVQAPGPEPVVERIDQPIIRWLYAPAEVQTRLARVRRSANDATTFRVTDTHPGVRSRHLLDFRALFGWIGRVWFHRAPGHCSRRLGRRRHPPNSLGKFVHSLGKGLNYIGKWFEGS